MFDDDNEEDWADPPVGKVAADHAATAIETVPEDEEIATTPPKAGGEECNAKDPPETMKSVSKAGGGSPVTELPGRRERQLRRWK